MSVLVALAHAAVLYAGGLTRARSLAGIPKAPKQRTKKNTWNKAKVLSTLLERKQKGLPLAASRVPQGFAARHYLGSWLEALAAAGIDRDDVRIDQRKWTRQAIIAHLRKAAQAGSDLRAENLKATISLSAVGREFGSLQDAIRAAGLMRVLASRPHGRREWTRERVIAVLRERAARDEHSFTPAIWRAVQLYFGGAEPALRSAGIPNPIDLRRAARFKKRRVSPKPLKRRGKTEP